MFKEVKSELTKGTETDNLQCPGMRCRTQAGNRVKKDGLYLPGSERAKTGLLAQSLHHIPCFSFTMR